MSDAFGGAGDFDIVGRYLISADPQAIARAMREAGKVLASEMGKIEDRSARLRDSKANANWKRYEKIALEAQERMFREQAKLVKRQVDFIAKTELERQRRANERAAIRQRGEWDRRHTREKSELKKSERTHAESEKRITKSHDEEEKRRTADSKQEGIRRTNARKEQDKRETDSARRRNQRLNDQARVFVEQQIQIVKGHYKERDRASQTQANKERARDRAAAAERVKRTAGEEQRRTNEEKAGQQRRQRQEDSAARIRDIRAKSAERRRLSTQQAAERARLSAQRHSERLVEQDEKHHQKLRENRHKAFWSLLRTTNETGQRALVHAGQGFWRRVHRDREHAQRLELADTQRHHRTMFSLFNRQSSRIRNINRTTVQQQGVIGAGQQLQTQGILGSLLSFRNLTLGAGGFLSARAIFGTVADYQQTQIAFEGLLGSAERAEDLLGRLRTFAEETPFQFQGLTRSARQLLGIGFAAEEVIPALEDIGGTAAVLGASESDIFGVVRALGQMAGQGKATAEDVNQISERFVGFNVRAAIAEHLGISTGEAMDRMKEGTIGADVAIEAILVGMREFPGAAEALERQSKTLTGRMSTLKDVINNLIIDSLAPLAPAVSNLIGQFTTFTENLFRAGGAFAMVRSGLLGIAAAAGVLLGLQLVQYFGAVVAAINPLTVAFFALAAGSALVLRHFPEVREEVFAFAQTVKDFAVEKLEVIGEFFARLAPSLEKIAGLAGTAFTDLLAGGGFGEFIDTMRDLLGEVGRIATNAAEPIIRFFQQAFAQVQTWLKTGGAEMIVGGFLDMLEAVVNTVRRAGAEILERGLLVPLLAGVAVFLAHSVLGIGFGPMILAAMATGLVVAAPQARERIGSFFSDVFGNIGDFITRNFLPAMVALGAFVGGPVVGAILSEAGQKIILGIAAGVVAGAGAILFGLIAGLRESLPQAINDFADIIGDLISGAVFAAVDALGPLANILVVLEVPLRGVLETFALLADVIGLIPTPVLVLGAALFGLKKAFDALVKTDLVKTFLPKLISFFQLLPTRVQLAGLAMQTFSTNVQRANQAAATTGPLTISQRAFGQVGVAAGTAGSAVSALGRALPGIGIAAGIGIPIALGLFEAARSRTERWNAEVKELRDQLSEGGTDVRSLITDEMLRNTEGLADALNSVNVSVNELAAAAASPDIDQIGELFTQINPQIVPILDQMGVSMAEFSRAAAEGDNAVDDLGSSARPVRGRLDSLSEAFRDIPESIRDVIDQSNEAAESFLDQQFAAGNLTDEQVTLYTALKEGTDVQATFASVAGEVSGALGEQDEALGRTRTRVDELTRRLDASTENSQAFRDALDSVTRSAIDVGQSRQAVQGTFDTITEGIREGQTLSDLSGNFLSAAEGIIGVFETLSDAGRPREAAREYQRLRLQLMGQYEQLGLNRDQAREFTNALVPPVSRIREEMNRAQRVIVRGLRNQRRNLLEALREGSLRGGAADAAQEMIDTIDATIASHGFGPAQVEVELVPSTRGGEPGLDRRRGRGIGGLNVPGFTGRAGGGKTAGGGGDLVAAWAGTADSISQILAALLIRFELFRRSSIEVFADTGNSIVRDMTKSMNQMVEAGKRGATAFVATVTSKLRSGTNQVGVIVRGYVTEIVKAINPLLSAIGEGNISLGGSNARNAFGFAHGGITPNIAEGGQGPIVHVYNEGRGGKGSAHGEAFIPFDPTMRKRSRAIAEETVRRLGGRTEFFAEGGITAPVANVSGDWQGLHPVFAQRLSAWATALGDNFHINSGFRSYDEQVAAYNRYLAGTGAPAAVPGTSLHEFGLAADGPHWSGRGPGTYQLNYPMSYEPWHVQPVEGKALGGVGGGLMAPQIPQPPDAGNRGIISQVAKATMQYLYDTVLAWAGRLAGSAPGLDAVAGGTPEIMAELQKQTKPRGWHVGQQWAGLTNLIREESSFNPLAQNPTSTAFGLFQFLDGTWASTGIAKTANYILQITAGLRYIASRYGNPFNAWKFWEQNHYYANGGLVKRPTMAVVGEDGPEVILPLTRPQRLARLLAETGLDRMILGSVMNPDRPDLENMLAGSRTRGGRPIDLDLNISVDGDVDPVTREALVGAVRSGVADGIGRAEAIEERW